MHLVTEFLGVIYSGVLHFVYWTSLEISTTALLNLLTGTAITYKNVDLCIQCLETLTEFSQDNQFNQQHIVDAQV